MLSMVQSQLKDFDLIIDMLFYKDQNFQNQITREQLSEFILNDMQVKDVSARDVLVLMNTHENLCSKNIFSKQDIKQVFSEPYKRAREAFYDDMVTQSRYNGA